MLVGLRNVYLGMSQGVSCSHDAERMLGRGRGGDVGPGDGLAAAAWLLVRAGQGIVSLGTRGGSLDFTL